MRANRGRGWRLTTTGAVAVLGAGGAARAQGTVPDVVWSVEAPEDDFLDADFSPDGQFVGATFGYGPCGGDIPCVDGGFVLYRSADGSVVYTTNEVAGELDFSPDSRQFAVTFGQLIEIRRTADGTLVQIIEAGISVGDPNFGPDGTTIYVNTGDAVEGSVRVFSVEDGSLLNIFEVTEHVLDYDLAAGATSIAATQNQDLLIVDTDDEFSPRFIPNPHPGTWSGVRSLAISPDRQLLGSVGNVEGKLFLLGNGQPQQTLAPTESYEVYPQEIEFSSDSQLVIMGGYRAGPIGRIWLYDVAGTLVAAYTEQTGRLVTDVEFSPDDARFLFTTTIDGGYTGVLTVANRPTPLNGCTADFDGNGTVGLSDFAAFRNAYVAGVSAADFDGDGRLTLADFIAFRSAYIAGC